MDKLSQLLRSRFGQGIRLAGRRSNPFSYEGPLGGDRATATAAMGWDGADVYGFRTGPGQLEATFSRGIVDFKPLDMELNEGRVRIAPRLRISPEPMELILQPGPLAQKVRINPAMCNSRLAFLIPMLADVASADGHVSIELDSCRIPWSDPAKSEFSGRLTLHDVQLGPGAMTRQLSLALGRDAAARFQREAVVPFQMVQGRIYHKDLELIFPDVTIRTHGSVGLDQTLAIVAEMPMPAAWQSGPATSAAQKNQTLQLPINGTLLRPQVDRRALEAIAQKAVRGAAENILEDQLSRQVDRLFQPPRR
jgi:hypothetical protein